MMNRSWLTVLLVAGLSFTLAPSVSEAARLGGGKSTGMQRAAPAKPAQNTPPSNAAQAAPAATPGMPPAAAPRSSWMGPIAGLAAGLGIAALFSHFGMGEGLANFVMMALLAAAAFVVIRLLMRRFAGAGAQRSPMAMAGAGAAGPAASVAPPQIDERPLAQRAALAPVIGSALLPPLAVPGPDNATLATPAGPALPVGFDSQAFERLAKMIFIRMQAANDSADLNDLRTFTTPELFASLRIDLHDRGEIKQLTDVVTVEARVLDFADEAERQVVSVRFEGLIREVAGAEPAPFNEVWHLVKPKDDSRAWAIAGIQQAQ